MAKTLQKLLEKIEKNKELTQGDYEQIVKLREQGDVKQKKSTDKLSALERFVAEKKAQEQETRADRDAYLNHFDVLEKDQNTEEQKADLRKLKNYYINNQEEAYLRDKKASLEKKLEKAPHKNNAYVKRELKAVNASLKEADKMKNLIENKYPEVKKWVEHNFGKYKAHNPVSSRYAEEKLARQKEKQSTRKLFNEQLPAKIRDLQNIQKKAEPNETNEQTKKRIAADLETKRLAEALQQKLYGQTEIKQSPFIMKDKGGKSIPLQVPDETDPARMAQILQFHANRAAVQARYDLANGTYKKPQGPLIAPKSFEQTLAEELNKKKISKHDQNNLARATIATKLRGRYDSNQISRLLNSATDPKKAAQEYYDSLRDAGKKHDEVLLDRLRSNNRRAILPVSQQIEQHFIKTGGFGSGAHHYAQHELAARGEEAYRKAQAEAEALWSRDREKQAWDQVNQDRHELKDMRVGEQQMEAQLADDERKAELLQNQDVQNLQAFGDKNEVRDQLNINKNIAEQERQENYQANRLAEAAQLSQGQPIPGANINTNYVPQQPLANPNQQAANAALNLYGPSLMSQNQPQRHAEGGPVTFSDDARTYHQQEPSLVEDQGPGLGQDIAKQYVTGKILSGGRVHRALGGPIAPENVPMGTPAEYNYQQPQPQGDDLAQRVAMYGVGSAAGGFEGGAKALTNYAIAKMKPQKGQMTEYQAASLARKMEESKHIQAWREKEFDRKSQKDQQDMQYKLAALEVKRQKAANSGKNPTDILDMYRQKKDIERESAVQKDLEKRASKQVGWWDWLKGKGGDVDFAKEELARRKGTSSSKAPSNPSLAAIDAELADIDKELAAYGRA